jgi:hypothetical protein
MGAMLSQLSHPGIAQMGMANLMERRGEVRQEQTAERQRQQQQERMDAFIATLPPEQQVLARMNPEGFMEQMTQAEFRAPPALLQAYQAAQAQGFQGSLIDYQAEIQRAGAAQTNVNVRQPGMFFDTDSQGNPRIIMGDADSIGSGIGASTRDRLLEQQVNTLSAAEDVVGRIDLLEGALAEAGPGSSGWVRRLRELGAGALNNLEELSSYGPEGQRFAQAANAVINEARNRSDLNDSTLRQFFSNEVSGVDLATNLLAYDMAKAVSPDNRVTDLDFRNMRQNLDQMSDAQRSVALRTLRQDTTDRAERARRRLRDLQPGSPQASELPEASEPRGLLDQQPQQPSAGQPARPTTQQEFDALPVGALYIDPDDGRTYRKTGGQ